MDFVLNLLLQNECRYLPQKGVYSVETVIQSHFYGIENVNFKIRSKSAVSSGWKEVPEWPSGKISGDKKEAGPKLLLIRLRQFYRILYD